MSYKNYKISQLLEIIGGGTPKTNIKEYWNGDIPWLSVKDFGGESKKIYDTEKKISELGLKNSSTKLLNKGDLIISARGTVGEVAQLGKPMAFNQSCYGLRAIENITSNDFMYYVLKYILKEIKNATHGSVFDTITKNTFDILTYNLPPIEEQKAIAKILSDLDDKIEVNNKINKRLEEMAQAIFKQWFVDFEFPNEEGKPYKSSGGEMVESELGMIPKGWKVGTFRNYIINILGGDWGKEQPQGNYIKDVYCIRGADIPEINKGNSGKAPVRFILEKNFINKGLGDGDLIVEISGGSPTQSTGRIAYINKAVLDKFDKGIVCTNFCRAISLKNRRFMEFIYTYWTNLYGQDVFFQFENGTTGIKNLDINNFLHKFNIINPSEEIIINFHKVVNILHEKIQVNGRENEKLVNLRDTLLPKLMSGEIRMPIEK
ncbi:restriction endonuclease subunit S [Clostridium sp.]|uniref:restriction endonuclease subunit S n=1 Tax=Clostridium sp. TaxID=1506 RepID=UPI00260BC5F8|nr:restriction endonuclease subunit S [Clostridium sp.]